MGIEEHVELRNPGVLHILKLYVATVRAPEDKQFCFYHLYVRKWCRLFYRVAGMLEEGLRTQGLRRGGATEMASQGLAMATIS